MYSPVVWAIFLILTLSTFNIIEVKGHDKVNVIRKIIFSPDIAPPAPFFSQGVQVDQTLYISGQLGLNKSDSLVEGFEGQARLCLDNIGHILRAAGADFGHVVKTTVLLSDMANYVALNEIYQTYFTDKPPARMAYQVAAIPRNALVEIEAIAVVGEIIDT